MMLKMKRGREKNLNKKRNPMNLKRKRKSHHHRMSLIGSKKSLLPPNNVPVGVRAGLAYRLWKKMAKLIKKLGKKLMGPAITKYRNFSLPWATLNSLRPLMTIHLSIQTAMMSTVRWWKRAWLSYRISLEKTSRRLRIGRTLVKWFSNLMIF